MSIIDRRLVMPDPAALAWNRALRAAGAYASHLRVHNVSQLIRRERAAGTWDLTDDYWLWAAENDVQSRVSLKQLRLATATSTFAADGGYTSDGAATFVNTGFIPTTHAVAMSAASCRIAVYERTNLGANGTTSFGARTATATDALWIAPRDGSNVLTGRNVSSSATFSGITDSRGFSATSRAGTTTGKGYKNGVALSDATVSAGTNLPNVALYIGCQNNNGTATGFRASQIAFACVGASLSAAQELAQYQNVQAWLQDIGAAV